MSNNPVMTSVELADLFARLPSPDALPAGAFKGRMPALPGTDRWPLLVRRLILGFINGPLGNWFWRGKWFDGEGGGANYWFCPDARLRKACYYSRLDSDSACLVLDYNRSENPGPVRALGAELRQWQPGKLLGRFRMGDNFTLYFTLEK